MRLPLALIERFSLVAYEAGWGLIRSTPEPVGRWLFERAADLAVWRDGPGVRQLRRNLSRVLAWPTDAAVDAITLERCVRAGLRSYARYWLETFRLPAMNVDQVLQATDTEGADRLDAALSSGRGVILALPHSGNWEVAGLWLVRRGRPFATVAERVKPEALYDRFVAYRESLGMQVLPLTGGSTSSTRAMLERLRAGGVVCLVAERDLPGRGVPVSFFGEPTTMPAGPAQLALATGAALLPVHTFYDGARWGQWVGTPIAFGAGTNQQRVAQATQQLADVFAERIAQHPSDWHMLQPIWPADRPSRPATVAAP